MKGRLVLDVKRVNHTTSGVFRGGHAPFWQKKIFAIGKNIFIRKNKKTCPPLCEHALVASNQRKFGPLHEILNMPLHTTIEYFDCWSSYKYSRPGFILIVIHLNRVKSNHWMNLVSKIVYQNIEVYLLIFNCSDSLGQHMSEFDI